ncbi:MAG: ABC transporter substrate-binding protein [Candidatus Heimdallarchaeota archaeon]|nr:ABC transporter substrate-binding protein [Candidatus Heimdallarchaeota archaeon]MCK4954740.1 ABC transporter substrate-binding protein [Candidatus Heimdallarchaeota archaeon]
MKIKKIAILILFVSILTIGSTTVLTPRAYDNDTIPDVQTPKAQTLTIVTRHDTTIQTKFRTEFLASQIAQDLGIAGMNFYSATTDEGWKTLLEDPAIGVDLAWGGGPALFYTMNKWGLLKPIDNTTLIDFINAKCPDIIAGAEMKVNDSSGNLIYVANAISSFGFTVNHDFLDQYALPVPTTWEELASPTYYINPSVKAISMGDPPLTTSNTKIYHIILQAFGWEEGWSILTRMAGNAGIYPGSVDTRAAAVGGEVGIAMTIDFYGTIAKRENPSTEYIIPEGQSIVNGDPIALGVNCDNLAAAEGFLQYLFSEEGQTVWMHEGLDRLPVNVEAFKTPYGLTRTDIYTLYNETLVNEGIEFNETQAAEYLDTTIYYFHQTLVKPHASLRTTWGEMVAQLGDGIINETYFADLVEELGAVNMTEAEALAWNEQYQEDDDFSAEKDSEWKSFAVAKYKAILAKIKPEDTSFQLTPVLVSTILVAAMTIFFRRRRK